MIGENPSRRSGRGAAGGVEALGFETHLTAARPISLCLVEFRGVRRARGFTTACGRVANGTFDAHHSPSLGSLDQQDFFQVSPQIGDCRSTQKGFRIFLRMGATLNNDDLPPFIFGGSFSVFCVDVTWAARIDARAQGHPCRVALAGPRANLRLRPFRVTGPSHGLAPSRTRRIVAETRLSEEPLSFAPTRVNWSRARSSGGTRRARVSYRKRPPPRCPPQSLPQPRRPTPRRSPGLSPR